MLRVENTEHSLEWTGLALLGFGLGLTTQMSRAPAPSWAVLESSTCRTRKSAISDFWYFLISSFFLASYPSVKAVAAAHGSMFPPYSWQSVEQVFCNDLVGLSIHRHWQAPCSLLLGRSLHGPVSFDLLRVKNCVKFCGFFKLKFHVNLMPYWQWRERNNYLYLAGLIFQSPAFETLTDVLCRNRVVIFSVGCF